MNFSSKLVWQSTSIGLGVLVLFFVSGVTVYSINQGQQERLVVQTDDSAQGSLTVSTPANGADDQSRIDHNQTSELKKLRHEIDLLVHLDSQDAAKAMGWILSDAYVKHFVKTSATGNAAIFDWSAYGKIALPKKLYDQYPTRFVNFPVNEYGSEYFNVQLSNDSDPSGYVIGITSTEGVEDDTFGYVDGMPKECVFRPDPNIAEQYKGSDCAMNTFKLVNPVLKSEASPGWKEAIIMTSSSTVSFGYDRPYSVGYSVFSVYHYGRKMDVEVRFTYKNYREPTEAERKKMIAEVEEIMSVLAEESEHRCVNDPYSGCE